MNYAVEQRLRMIEFLLISYGSIGRSELTNYFGISEPQATRDFKMYNELAMSNMLFNNKTKRHVKSDSFKPVYKWSKL